MTSLIVRICLLLIRILLYYEYTISIYIAFFEIAYGNFALVMMFCVLLGAWNSSD